ncbi:sugar phosphate isomerase/epimerase family protein [Cucumibacter marinus]|uniref:sugar phosphate isomerase/epimerase family protein n=1 Tax=Cucumibacter marinus TaxID=1121252 RepID=UPI00041B1AF3|nr:sugar phosphate isomerase/epimerase [Cucumibacter marinus]
MSAKQSIKGPAVFLAQFAGDQVPFNSFASICRWAADKGFVGVQVPTWRTELIDLGLAASSHDYCDEILGVASEAGVEITELSTHLQGHCVAVHPAYDELFDGLVPSEVRGKPSARQEWAVDQMYLAAQASARLGLTHQAAFPGALAWPYFYPWPTPPANLAQEAFDELARRWRPILDAYDEQGVGLCFEVHPGVDVHDGITFEMFLERVGEHPRCQILYDPSHFLLQGMDYVGFIETYAERIGMFHVKDAELRTDDRRGVYGGFQSWHNRAARFRSLGDGQIDFRAVFSALTAHGFEGWAVLEWECFLKHPEAGAREGAVFIRDHIIELTDRAFDDFAAPRLERRQLRKMMGIDPA